MRKLVALLLVSTVVVAVSGVSSAQLRTEPCKGGASNCAAQAATCPPLRVREMGKEGAKETSKERACWATTSSSRHETVTRTNKPPINKASTHVIGTIGTKTVYQVTIAAPPGSAEVQNAVNQAGQAIKGQGSCLLGPGALQGPVNADSGTVVSRTVTKETPTTSASVHCGPTTVGTGTDKSDQTKIPADAVDVNTDTHVEIAVDELYQPVFTATSTFTIQGGPCH